MRAPSPRRNGTAAGLRRLCLETGFTLLPIGLALLMAGLLLWLMGVDPLAYYGFILRKGLLAPYGWQASLTRMGPLLLIAASLMVAFSAGLWNLGGDGQFMLGAVLASAIAPALLSHGVPLSITLFLALLAGALAGVLWGLLPAALKIWRNINEIITSLMMSFLGVSLANVLVKLLLADPATTVPQTRNLPWEQRLPMLFGGQVSSGLLLGLLAVLLTYAVINHTAFGLRIRVMGANPRAAIHAGLPVGALTLAVFALSAGLAGLAGAVEIIGIQGNVRADWNPAYSLVVVPLVFLAQFNGFGSIALVFVFSVLSNGSESAARRMGVPNHFTLLTVALLLIVPGLTRLAVARLRQALRHRALRNTPQGGA